MKLSIAPTRRLTEPMHVVLVLLAVALLFLVVGPIAKLLITSFETKAGAFTFANYLAAYGRARYLDAMVNSLVLGLLSAVIATAFAVPMAWAVSRTDMPAKPLVWGIVLGAFLVPPYLGAIGWILLAGPNAGALNRLWRWASGAEEPLLNIYSFSGLAFLLAIHSFPLVFLFVKSSLDLISSEMEDAANVLGAGVFRTLHKITLPLVLPAILAGMIIVFLDNVALFGTPSIIGIPARINVATTQLWQFFESPVRVEVAAAYSMPLLLVTLGLIALQRLALGRGSRVTQTGKGGERRTIRLSVGRWALLGWCLLVGMLSVAMPVALLLQASFAKAWGNGLALSNFTLANYRYMIFEHEMALPSIWNTLWFSAAAATAASAIALLVAYVVQRNLTRFANVLGFLAMAPFVIPGIVMAIGFYAAYAPPPLALYGTAAIVILAFTARFLPIAYANAGAAMRGVNPEMEEAARILGAGQLRTISAVTVPLVRRALLGSWLIVFIVATRELSAAVFLVGPTTRTMSVLLYDLSEAGDFEKLSALGGIMLALTFVIVVIGMKLAGRDFMLRRG